jgi:UDP-N-acetylglucosamine 3-dehydrogenase
MPVVLRGGVLGLGSMGRNHLRVIAASDRVELAGAVEVNGRAGGPRPYPVHRSLDALLRERLDFAIVAVPTRAHAEATARLAEAGVHALVEKPLAGTVEEAGEVARACSEAGVRAAVGHVERYNAALCELRVRVRGGEIGRPLMVTTERMGPLAGRTPDVGVAQDLGTHDLDLLHWLGDSPIEAVAAQAPPGGGGSHEDVLTVTGHLASGLVFDSVFDRLSPIKVRRVRVLGEAGLLEADSLTGELTLARVGAPAAKLPLVRAEPLSVQLEAFCDFLQDREGRPVVSLGEGVRAVAYAEAVLESAARQQVVEVPPR